MTEWWWAYLALGAFVGFFSGMLGIGGGSMMVPVLAFIFAAKGFGSDHAVHLALGTGITTILFTSVVSVRAHHLRQSVNWLAFRTMATGVLPGKAVMTGFGAVIGFISSLTATGGASVVVPFLIKRRVPIHEAIGTA